jgi:SAM-dependent methyltransferase
MDANQFQKDILLNLERWNQKPLLRIIYQDFHRTIAAQLSGLNSPKVVELGSGIGNIKEIIPGCLRTDLFPNPWIDQIENAYALSFAEETLSDLILFDVFHHLRYPGTALREFERVLRPGGRVLIFDPFISLMGAVVFGLLHTEPVAWRDYIDWYAPKTWSAQNSDYYAAQGNATRVFFGRLDPSLLKSWKVVSRQRFAAFSYVGSGGYSGPQVYPESAYPLMKKLDLFLDNFPVLFATRTLVVLEKKAE